MDTFAAHLRARLEALLVHARGLAPHATLLGQSMGGALVLDGLAGGLRPDRAIAVSAPLTIPLGPGLLRELVFLWGPEARRSRQYVSALERRLAAERAQLPPVLVVHGTRDGVTPVFHAERLAAALNEAGMLLCVPGGHHFNPLLRDDVLSPVLDWARAASPRPVAAP